MIYVIKSISELNRCQFMEKYVFTTYMLCMGERICGRLRRNIPNVTKVVWLSNDVNHTKILLFVYVYWWWWWWLARNSTPNDGGEKLNFDRRNFGETRKSVETTTDEATHTRSLDSLSLSPTISLDCGGGVVYKDLRKY
ncbi:hypothetical protein YC2023_104772 [Brassica napus]